MAFTAALEELQHHCKLKPPQSPSTSKISPPKYRPGVSGLPL